jgi:hypothetical protein
MTLGELIRDFLRVAVVDAEDRSDLQLLWWAILGSNQ